jgi:hypothetical protein
VIARPPRVSDELGNISGAARADHIGNVTAAGFNERRPKLQNRRSDPGPQVHDLRAICVAEVVQGHDVAVGDIHNMDVVADGRSVGSRIVVTEDR